MEMVQRMANLNITGGLRSSATDALDIHANVLPFQKTLRKICHRATLRMATLPEAHPLARGVKAAYNFCAKRNFQGRKRHASPIQKMETISPVRHYPKWEPDTTISIAGKEKDALTEEEEADEAAQSTHPSRPTNLPNLSTTSRDAAAYSFSNSAWATFRSTNTPPPNLQVPHSEVTAMQRT
jgi:hypothetical protein